MMQRILSIAGAVVMLVLHVACLGGGGYDDDVANWTRGEATVDGETYPLRSVSMSFEFGEDGYYVISGAPREDDTEDCVPGLSSGMSLYGPLPRNAASATDLIGEQMRLEFSGDGDDANLCFVGTEGLLGASKAWVKIRSVLDDRVEFEMNGDFVVYDGRGGREPRPVRASALGTAQITDLW